MTTSPPEDQLTADAKSRVRVLLQHLYPEVAEELTSAIVALSDQFQGCHSGRTRVTEEDAFLITYGDSLVVRGEAPLQSLRRFLSQFGEHLSAVHILPFFPYSSDDGFSVIDYLEVRPDLGTWKEIEAIASDKKLMIDAVINHFSKDSHWFEDFLNETPGFEKVAFEVTPDTDLSMVTRPRTTPLLTQFSKSSGASCWVWTTFSDDQIDVNYRDPATLLRILEVILEYAARGGAFLRIDAATYMWKELGTNCASLENTHRLVQLLRAVLDLSRPQTSIITETNVPHAENISYLGTNEAQLVYNFALPPLVLHTIATQDASALTTWARALDLPEGTTFFNFLASHDGIGVRGVEGILDRGDIRSLAERVTAHGGRVSMRSVGGREEPYELNINYVDALCAPSEPDEARAVRTRLAHAIMFALRGVPAIYVHSFVGSRSAPHLVEATGSARSINREQLHLDEIATALEDANSSRGMIYESLNSLLAVRTNTLALHPLGQQQVLDLGPDFFAVKRTHDGQTALCIHNVSGEPQQLPQQVLDAVSGAEILYETSHQTDLEAYGLKWFGLSRVN